MDKERLFLHLEQHYCPKKDILNRLPLGVPLEGVWQELLNRRLERRILLPLHTPSGDPYWYVLTEKMIAASERIAAEQMVNETGFDPYQTNISVSSLEEVYYTSYVEGAMISMQDAMAFLQSEEEPRDIHEQMILNNRQASNFIASNLYRPVDEAYIRFLAYTLTERMDNGGEAFRTSDIHEIPYMGEEHYTVAPASSIPDRMRELICFLQDDSVHPLLKAGIAQAWVLLVRPFDEGNERLTRLLSATMLIRAGYSFFNEVSLSALIARQSYEYYTAAANILRLENGNDLTYFLEYFLNLLVRALDERKVRMEQRLARDREEAQTTAAQPQDIRTKDEWTMAKSLADSEDTKAIRQKLNAIKRSGNLMSPAAEILEEFLNEGIAWFTKQQLLEGLGYSEKQVEGVITRLKEKGIILSSHRDNQRMVYRFSHLSEKRQAQSGYSRELLETLQTLSQSEISPKDKRVGNILLEKLVPGSICLSDYEARGWATKWVSDMRLAAQLGLVEKTNSKEYMIRTVPKRNYQQLPPAQRMIASAIYKEFGEDLFSLGMAAATLAYSPSHMSAILHRFTLLKILSCRKEDVNRYQFLITPEKYPECFAV